MPLSTDGTRSVPTTEGVIQRAKLSQISAYVPAAIEFHCNHSSVRTLDGCGGVAVLTYSTKAKLTAS